MCPTMTICLPDPQYTFQIPNIEYTGHARSPICLLDPQSAGQIPNLPAKSPICLPDTQSACQIPNLLARSPIYLPDTNLLASLLYKIHICPCVICEFYVSVCMWNVVRIINFIFLHMCEFYIFLACCAKSIYSFTSCVNSTFSIACCICEFSIFPCMLWEFCKVPCMLCDFYCIYSFARCAKSKYSFACIMCCLKKYWSRVFWSSSPTRNLCTNVHNYTCSWWYWCVHLAKLG